MNDSLAMTSKETKLINALSSSIKKNKISISSLLTSTNNKSIPLGPKTPLMNNKAAEKLGWKLLGIQADEKSKNGSILVEGQKGSEQEGFYNVVNVNLRSGTITQPNKDTWQRVENVTPDVEQRFGIDLNQDYVLGKTEPRTTRYIENGSWWRALSPTVQHSISTWKQPQLIGDELLKEVNAWVIAGDNSEGELSSFIKSNKLRVSKSQSSLFNLPGIESFRIKPDSLSQFQRIQKRASANGIQLWLEAPIKLELDSPIDVNSITEPGFTGTINVPENTPVTNASTWYLQDTDLSNPNAPLYGINAVTAWGRAGGDGVVVSVNDSVMDIFHPDLANSAFDSNIDLTNSGNNYFIDGDLDGLPDVFDSDDVTLPGGDSRYPVNPPTTGSANRRQSHGTAVSGIIVAQHNGQNAVGIAPQSQWIPNAGSNTNFSLETRRLADIINNSWGSSSSRGIRVPTPTALQRWENSWSVTVDHPAISQLVNSAGNGRNRGGNVLWQNTNNRMYNNHREVISVGATTQAGDVEFYSTPGPGVLISAPVNTTTAAGGRTLTSDVTDDTASNTDNRGYADGNTTALFWGTSSSAPMVSGTIALMLEANPSLTRRDIQHILVQTAQKNRLTDSDLDGELDGVIPGGTTELRNSFIANANTDGLIAPDPYNTGWFQNSADHWVSDSFGFGIVDAGAAVEAAANWSPVDPERHVQSETMHANESFTIPQGQLGDLESLTTAGFWQINTNLKVEWAEVSLELNAPDLTELMVVLVSPSGTRSVLLGPGGTTPTSFNDTAARAMVSNQFWDENANGRWALEVLDVNNNAINNATIENVKLNLYGTCFHPDALKVASLENLRETNSPIDEKDLGVVLLQRGGLNRNQIADLEVKTVGSDDAWGSFSNGSDSGLMVDRGLILTSGKAIDAIGPNQAEDTTTNHKKPGHWLLDRQIEQRSQDAAGLELRFTPSEDVSLQWSYQLGSEEFEEWAGSQYNDVGGLFLADVSKTPDLALSGEPISNVDNLTSGGGLNALTINEVESFGSIGKTRFTNPICGPLGWEYDGGSLEPKLTREANLRAGRTYYMSALIGDASDGLYDSGLLIGEAESSGKIENIFTIKLPKRFKKRFVDIITSFDPSTDALEIDQDSFGIDDSKTIATAKNKRKVKKVLAKQEMDFLYDRKKGGLYLNENGSDKGFGDGGLIALLPGGLDLQESNIVLA